MIIGELIKYVCYGGKSGTTGTGRKPSRLNQQWTDLCQTGKLDQKRYACNIALTKFLYQDSGFSNAKKVIENCTHMEV
jgi:hypothetical protein